MESTLLEAYDRPVPVRVRDRVVLVGELRIRDLVDLQAWTRDHSWDPWDIPAAEAEDGDGGSDLGRAMALVIVHADLWPPPLDSPAADAATDRAAYDAEWAHVAFGRSNGLDRETSAAILRAAKADGVPWQKIQCAAWGERPELAANRILNWHEGAAPTTRGEGPDWALSVAALVLGDEARRGLTFAEVAALTISQYRLLCRAHRDPKGRLALTDREGPQVRPRPGEPWKAAKGRRAALIGWATARLERFYRGDGDGDGPEVR